MALDDDRLTRQGFRLSPLIASPDFPPLAAGVRVDFAARTARGRLRSINEDHYLVLRLDRGQETLLTSLPADHYVQRFEEHAYGMIVADGMGASGGGEQASRIAVASLVQLALHFGKWQVRVDPAIAQDVTERLEQFYRQVSGALVHESVEGAAPLRTTLTAVVSGGRDLFFAHVGHSRAYLYRNRELIQLTEDHTLEARRDPARAHLMDLTSAASDLRHILTDTLGAGVLGPRIDIERFEVCDGDVVLLCTNGLTDTVADEAIARVLASPGRLSDQCDTLIERVAGAGGEDDATVLLARYHVPPHPRSHGDERHP